MATADGSAEHIETIDALLAENRTFPPPEDIKRDALVTGTFLYDEAAADDEGFWAKQAAELLDWDAEWTTILDWQLPYAKWFVGGKLNAAANCLDRHVAAGNGDRVAIHWEGEPGDTRTITYAELPCRGAALRQRPQGTRRRQGRPGQHLPADDPRGGGGDAGVRPHRGAAQRRVRRLLGAGARRPDQRRRGQAADHRRRRIPARRGVPAQAGGRRGGGRDVDDRARRRRAPRRQRRRDGRGPRPLVPRARRRRRGGRARPSRWMPRTSSTCCTRRARPASPRASCTPPAATSPRSPSPTSTCSTSTRRPTCSGAPPTSVGSPGTATSSTGRWPTARRS